MRDDDLERTLTDIGRNLAYPSPAHTEVGVRERLRARRRSGLGFFGARPAFVPALATAALLLVVIAVASPGIRSAAGEFLRLRGIDIFPVPSVAPVVPSAGVAFPGERTTLDDARRRVRFTIRVPTAAELGSPDDVFVETTATSDRVTLVYRQRPGIKTSPEAGVAALVVEFRGALDDALLGKATGPGTRIEAVTVNGGRGFWLEGAPHLFFYRDPGGDVRQDTLRLAGNTLVWEQGGVTIRLEADVQKDVALRIASAFR